MSVSILVVDDEPDVADLFRQRFRRETRQGTYVIHFAASGEEVLDRLAEEFQPALMAVLSDINMPGMDGLQLLGEIKQRCPNLPVLLVTAYGDDERRRHARGLGAFDFITKPVDFDQLKARLQHLPAPPPDNPPRSLNGRFTRALTDKPYRTEVGYGGTLTRSRHQGLMAAVGSVKRPSRGGAAAPGTRR